MSNDKTNTTARSGAAAKAGSPRAGDSLGSTSSGSSTDYCRERDLPRLIALWPDEASSTDPAVRARVLGKLRRALRAERRRGLAGHWTYDLARHSQLFVAYRHEVEGLKRSPIGGRFEKRR